MKNSPKNVLNEIKDNIEHYVIIFINDNSTDNTQSILFDYVENIIDNNILFHRDVIRTTFNRSKSQLESAYKLLLDIF
jgi:uncharacterized protein (UPF0248 family)